MKDITLYQGPLRRDVKVFLFMTIARSVRIIVSLRIFRVCCTHVCNSIK